MGFTNPATQQNPFYRFRDEFFWPAISGEQLPPALAFMSYGVKASRPFYVCNPPTGQATVTFPNVPRAGAVSGKQTLTLSGYWMNQQVNFGGTNGQGMIFCYGDQPTFPGGTGGFVVAAAPAVAIQAITGVNGNRYYYQTRASVGGLLTFDSGILLPPGTLRLDLFTIVLHADGSVSFQTLPQDGSAPGPVVTDSRAVWLPNNVSAQGSLAPYFAQSGVTGGGAPSTFLTQVRATYT